MTYKTLGSFLIAAVVFGACAGEMILDSPGEGGGGGGGGGGADAGAVQYPDAALLGSAEGRQYFTTYVQPILLNVRPKGACALCHQGTNTANGPIFMGVAQADNYQALLDDVGIIGADPAQSSLLVRGDHAGNMFCQGLGVPYNQCEQNEYAVISNWIRLENEP